MENLTQRVISLSELKGVPAHARARALYGQLMAYLSAAALEVDMTPQDITAVGTLLARSANPLVLGTLLGFFDGDGTPVEDVRTMLDSDATVGTLVMIQNEAPGTAPFRCPVSTETFLPILVEDFDAIHDDGTGQKDVVRQRMTFTYQGLEYFASNLGMPNRALFKVATLPVK